MWNKKDGNLQFQTQLKEFCRFVSESFFQWNVRIWACGGFFIYILFTCSAQQPTSSARVRHLFSISPQFTQFTAYFTVSMWAMQSNLHTLITNGSSLKLCSRSRSHLLIYSQKLWIVMNMSSYITDLLVFRSQFSSVSCVFCYLMW